MKDNPDQIRKLVIKPDEIEDDNSWRMPLNKNLHSCESCNSNLTYMKLNWGIVAEDNWYGIMGNQDNRTFALREIGIVISCAECGRFHEHYSKWFYPEDKLVMIFDELGDVEMEEINHCLNQYDQKKDFTPLYKCSELNSLKENLVKYEKKYPLKDIKEIEENETGRSI